LFSLFEREDSGERERREREEQGTGKSELNLNWIRLNSTLSLGLLELNDGVCVKEIVGVWLRF